MKKIRKNNRYALFLLYAVIGSIFIIPIPAFAQSEKGQADLFSAAEDTIRALADPFVPKLKAPPKPPEPPKEAPPVVVPEVVPPKPEVVIAPPVILPPEFVLSGVIYQSSRPMAIINGEIYEEGQKFSMKDGKGEVLLKKISRGLVETIYQGKSFTFTTD